MRFLPPGDYRFDWIILLTYQMTHFFGVQQLFTILLEYTPKTTCIGDKCFNVVKKCMECLDCQDICTNSTDATACREESGVLYFESAAKEYSLYCGDGFTTYITSTSFQFVGLLLGNIVLGVVADKFGRRFTIIASLLLGIPSLILSAAINSIAVFYFFRFVIGFCAAGTMSVGWAYCSELASPHYRFRLRAFSSWANARMMMLAVSWIAGEWRLASHLCAGVCLVTIALVFVMPESPMWLRREGYYERAHKAEERIAYLKGIEYVAKDDPTPSEQEKLNSKDKVNIMTVFKNKELTKGLLVLWSMWFSVGLMVYNVDLGGADMTKNLWVGQFLSSILLSIARITLGFADYYIPSLGRRLVFILFMSLAIVSLGVTCTFNYMEMKGGTLYLIAYLTVFVTISLCWEPCYLAAAELMPTEFRATSTASCNIMTRIANLFSSAVVRLKQVHEPLVFMITMLVGVEVWYVVFKYLKETKGISLEATKKTQKKTEVEKSTRTTKTTATTETEREKEEQSRKEFKTEKSEKSRKESKERSEKSEKSKKGSKEKSEKSKKESKEEDGEKSKKESKEKVETSKKEVSEKEKSQERNTSKEPVKSSAEKAD